MYMHMILVHFFNNYAYYVAYLLLYMKLSTIIYSESSI